MRPMPRTPVKHVRRWINKIATALVSNHLYNFISFSKFTLSCPPEAIDGIFVSVIVTPKTNRIFFLVADRVTAWPITQVASSSRRKPTPVKEKFR
jgi:hypothetical protein